MLVNGKTTNYCMPDVFRYITPGRHAKAFRCRGQPSLHMLEKSLPGQQRCQNQSTHFVVILMGMMKYMIVGSLFRQTLIGFPARFVSVSVLIGQSFSRSLLSVHACDRSLGAKICRPSPNRRSALNVGTSNAASTWLSPNQGIGGKADADLVDHNLWRLLVAEVAYQRLIHRL